MPTVTDDKHVLVRRLLDQAGITYADEAGIRLKDKPMPLFQLLVACMLASKPIDAAVAMRAAHELWQSGLRTPSAVLKANRATVIHAFGRAHYVRYDESLATRLVEIAQLLQDEYDGDLRNLAVDSRFRVHAAADALQQFAGIGKTGADIFLREVQDVWPWARPYFDDRTVAAARQLGLPDTSDGLYGLAPRSTARLAAALVRVSLDDDLRAAVVA